MVEERPSAVSIYSIEIGVWEKISEPVQEDFQFISNEFVIQIYKEGVASKDAIECDELFQLF